MGRLRDIFDIEARVEGPDGLHGDGIISRDEEDLTATTEKMYSPESIAELLQDAARERQDAERDGSLD